MERNKREIKKTKTAGGKNGAKLKERVLAALMVFCMVLAGPGNSGLTLRLDAEVASGTGETLGDFCVSGGTSGTDYTYDSSSGLLTISGSGEYTVTMADNVASTSNTIKVTSDSAVAITLEDVAIESSSASPLEIDAVGDVTILLSGDNTFKSTADGYAGLQKSSTDNTLIITSVSGDYSTDGKLTATGYGSSYGGAGIGGASGKEGKNITINGGTIIATGGIRAAAIGGGRAGSGSYIEINGGDVTATSGQYAAAIGGGDTAAGSYITITGGTVNAAGVSGGAGIGGGDGSSNGTGSYITITGGTVSASSNKGAGIGGGIGKTGTDITISGGYITASSNYGSAIGSGQNGGTATVTITGGCFGDGSTGDGTVYDVEVASGYSVISNPDTTTSGTYPYMVGKKSGDLFISGGTENTDWTYADNVLTVINGGEYTISMSSGVTSTSSDRIKVTADDAVEITLVDVDITSSTSSAFEIDAKGDVKILLSGDSTLKANENTYCAGLQKTSTDNTLTITSADGDGETSGSITATGGLKSAGIGAAQDLSAANITINGGTITATSASHGAGIGGASNSGNGTNIIINGGIVIATSSGWGAGIGGGSGGYGEVTINGGIVTATSEGVGAGIGSGYSGSGTTVTITGGYILAYSNSTENPGDAIGSSGLQVGTSTVIITGGYFGSGDTTKGTVYDVAVASGYEVAENEDGDTKGEYPYLVQNQTTYSVTLEANGGTIADGADVTSYTYGVGAVLPDSTQVTREGYVFCGWYEESDFSGEAVTEIGTDETGDKVYYAKWVLDKAFVITGDSGYSYDGNVLEITGSGEYTISMNTEAGYTETDTDRIVVSADDAVEITLESVSITSSSASPFEITGSGDVTILLSGDNTFTSTAANYAGLQKSSTNNTLIITSVSGEGSMDGSLTATGGEYGAGIGGGYADGSGTILITGGTVEAVGGERGAGIGGGGVSGNTGTTGDTEGGTITIKGGSVTATGGNNAAGIGSGFCGWSYDITVSGGTVYAESAYRGAGIGGGNTGKGGDITITGGNVTAIGGEWGAGIGSGITGSSYSINISGGTINATGGTGNEFVGTAGIGGGSGSSTQGYGEIGTIVISGGTVTATSGSGSSEGASIGGASGTGKSGTVTISGGYILAYASDGSSGYISAGESGTVTITGGYYGEGDTDDWTVYSQSVASGYYVADNDDTTYLYAVKEISTGDLVISGAKYGTDYNYEDGLLLIMKAGEYTITMADSVTTTTDTIKVTASDDVTITLDGVTIEDSSISPFEIDADGDVTILLSGDNTLKTSEEGYAGLAKTSVDNTLTITSADGDGKTTGSLTASGGKNGAGIGGYKDSSNAKYSGSNIIIAGGTITATGGSESAGIGGGREGNGTYITITGGVVNATGNGGGAGIGGGYGASGQYITITGGTVTATGNAGIGGGSYSSASDITISGGYIKASSIGKSSLFGSVGTITITGGYFANGSISAQTVYSHSVADGYYVTDNTDADSSSTYPYVVKQASSGDLVISDGTEGYDWVYEDGVLTIKRTGEYTITMADGVTSTSDTIKVTASDDVTITLDGVAITSSTDAALEVDASGDVTIVLSGENTLASTADGCSGIQKTSDSNTLTITGGGCLAATGGNGADAIDGGNISITGGCFADGDTDADTIYGISVASGYSVVENTDSGTSSAYPYMVGTSYGDFYVTGNASGISYDTNVLGITEGGSYIITMNTAEGVTSTTTDRIYVTAADDVEITIADIDVTSSEASPFEIDAEGNVTILLSGENILTSEAGNYAGLQVTSQDNTITITSASCDGSEEGSLEAEGGSNAAGIGGGYGSSGGSIIINGGTIKATGGSNGAGIGGGYDGDGGVITINGGSVTAKGGTIAAGIGGGYSGDGGTISGGTITINDGTVTATGGSYASGIGGGTTGRGSLVTSISGSGGTITINGGTVTVTGGALGGAAIGGGASGKSGDITITGGTVSATGGSYGAGIGSGSASSCNTITITGGIVTAAGGSNGAAGIGGGGNSGSGGVITISGGYILASRGSSSASIIGKGNGGSNGTITITGGCFGDGSTSADTVYSVSVATGYSVIDNPDSTTNATYPYMVGMTCNDLFISGGTEGTDWTYDNNVLEVICGGTFIITMAENVTSTTTDRISVTAGDDVEITLVDVVITSDSASPFEIDATGDVTLLLSGESVFTSEAEGYAGLQKTSEDNTLTITSESGDGEMDGSLTVTGGDYAAGIGGSQSCDGSNIIIDGGTITATGGKLAAGIGGGQGANGTDITINGGYVEAAGGHDAAAIGGGSGVSGEDNGNGTGIVINGGTVVAEGNDAGAGIGGGLYGAGSVTINGGTVTASSANGAGIGSGSDVDDDSAGTVEINGGTVTATSTGWGAGIGGGSANSGTVVITGGIVTATGGTNGGAGIGGGYAGNATVTISGGYILADTGTDASAIGAGNSGITISVTITGGCYGKGSLDAGTVYDRAVYTGYYVRSNADDDTNTLYPYEVSIQMYVVTIPATVELGNTVDITAEDVNIPESKSLVVSLSGTSEFAVTLDGNDSVKLEYGVTVGTSSILAGSSVLSVAGGTVDASGSALMVFAEPDDEPIYSGSYSGTLTFDIAIEDN